MACFVAVCPSAIRLAAPSAPAGTWCADLPQALIICSAGFFGFVLWAEVSARLYSGGSHRHMAHFTLLLILFSAAAYKYEHTAFMAMTLLSEFNSIPRLAGKLLGMATTAGAAGTDSAIMARAATVLAAADRFTFLAFRLVPHALLGLLVLFQPSAFATRAYYALAAGGMLYMNFANARRAAALLAAPAAKAHEQ